MNFIKKLPSWHYDEMRQIGIDFESSNEVLTCDSSMSKIRNIKNENQHIIQNLNLNNEQIVLEIGTGTGEFAIEVSHYCKKVIAIDVSPKMLEYAQKKALGANKKNIEFVNAGFLTFSWQGEPFDAIISQIALHHVPDIWKIIAIQNIYKMLKDGGKFFLRDVIFSFNLNDYEKFFTVLTHADEFFHGNEVSRLTESLIKNEYPTFSWIN